MIRTKKLDELGIAITFNGSRETLPAEVIEKVVEYCIRDITEGELEEAIKEYRFEKEIEDFTKENKDEIEFYIQHKKDIDKDLRKQTIFYREFLIREPEEFQKRLLERIKGYPEEFFDEALRELILEEQGYGCFLCDCDLTFTYPHLHHVDYDKQNCSKDNLVFLCPRCHGKTNGNRDFWKIYITEHKEQSSGKVERVS